MRVEFSANGEQYDLEVEPRELLLDVLRSRVGLTSVHAACEQGACGVCTVRVDGVAIQSCLMFALQVQGREVQTVEALARAGELHPLQQAFSDHHALQCGYCTPGMVLAALELLERNPSLTRSEIEHALSGNLCRCTGYAPIVDAVAAAASGSAASRESAP